MDRKPVTSSMIAEIGYSKETKTLEVKFTRNDSIYQYSNVSVEDYNKLMAAPSIGIHFGTTIKGNAAYPFKKV